MPEIKIEITIPYFEYKNWNHFHEGIEEVMTNLKHEIGYYLKAIDVQTFIIKVEVID